MSASVTEPKTIALAQSTGSRFGTAVNEARIMPVEYSALITSTPSTPIASCAICEPISAGSSGLKLARSPGLLEPQWLEITAEARIGKPIVSTVAISRDQRVERTLRSFVHSETITRHCVTRPRKVDAGIATTLMPLLLPLQTRARPGSDP